MAYKVIRKFQKLEQDTWGGITFNVQKALNTTPDPRDSQFNQFVEIRDAAKEFAAEIRTTIPGYVGSDREFENDNVLNIIFYFNDAESAITFRNTFYTSNTAVKRFGDIIKEKQELGVFPVYTVTTTVLDESGNIINP